MTRIRPPAITLALLLAVALGAACGGSSSGSGTTARSSPPATSEQSPSTAEPPASEPATSSASGSAGDAAFCTAAKARMHVLRSRISQLFSGGTPAGYAKAFDLLQQQFREVQATAPDEIKGDLGVIADGVQRLAKVMHSGTLDAVTAVQAARLANSKRFRQAARHLSAWAQAHCPSG